MTVQVDIGIHLREKFEARATVFDRSNGDVPFVGMMLTLGGNTFTIYVNPDRLEWAQGVAAAINAPVRSETLVFISAEDLPKHPNGGL